jgi:spore coat protein CotH
MKNLVVLVFIFSINFVAKAQLFTTSNLPIVKIQTIADSIVDYPKVLVHIGIINNGILNNILDDENDLSSYASIEIRGSSSQWFDKKSYSFELRDSIITDSTIDKMVLGMPAESDWILYAPYTDKTLMRDVLTQILYAQMGQYAPKCKFVELVIDGNYKGIYVLEEKIKRDKNRVNIAKLKDTDTSGVNISGGYLLKIDKTTGNFLGGFGSNVNTYQGNPKNIYFQYDYPKLPNIQQQTYIQSYIDSFENAMLASDWQDVNNGYRKFINEKSFMDFFFLNELGHNVDGYRLSTYLHKKRADQGDGKLHMGPVWDFNLAYQNADYCEGWRTDSWAMYQLCDSSYYPFWWDRFFADSTYVNDLKCRYNYYRKDILSEQNIMSKIDSIVLQIDTAAINRNYNAWPILGTYVWPNYYVGTSFNEEIDSLKSYINKRLIWMDSNIPGTCAIPLNIEPVKVLVEKFDINVYPTICTNEINID